MKEIINKDGGPLSYPIFIYFLNKRLEYLSSGKNILMKFSVLNKFLSAWIKGYQLFLNLTLQKELKGHI